MVAFSTSFAVLASLLVSQTLGAALPTEDMSLNITARGGGLPDTNPPGVMCYNLWETVTVPPVVQYWYVVVPNAHNTIKADRVWNHLNLNGCAPTENKYHVQSVINGCALTFHTSEACTAQRVSHALRSGSDPPINIACEYTGPGGPSNEQIGARVGTAVADTAIIEVLSSLGGL